MAERPSCSGSISGCMIVTVPSTHACRPTSRGSALPARASDTTRKSHLCTGSDGRAASFFPSACRSVQISQRVGNGIAADDYEQLNNSTIEIFHQILKRLPLIDWIDFQWIRVEHSLSDIPTLLLSECASA